MKKIVVPVFLVFLIFACGEQPNKQPKNLSASKIYTLYCQQCHGNKGNLLLNGASDFTKSTLTLEERIDVITNGRKTMLPYKNQLTASQIKAVAEYTMNL